MAKSLIYHRKFISTFSGLPSKPHSKGKFVQPMANVRLLYKPVKNKYSTLGRVVYYKFSSLEKSNREMTTVSTHWLNQSQLYVVFNKFRINKLEKCFRKLRYLSAQERDKSTQFINKTSTHLCRIIISLDMNLKKAFLILTQSQAENRITDKGFPR